MSQPWASGPWYAQAAFDGSGAGRWHVMTNWNDLVLDIMHKGTATEANARLIALAPEMAEFIATVGYTDPTDADRAIALLARARGEAEA